MCHRHLMECAHRQFRHVQSIPIHSSPAIREVNVFQMNQTLQDYLFHNLYEDMQGLLMKTSSHTNHGDISRFFKVSHPMLFPSNRPGYAMLHVIFLTCKVTYNALKGEIPYLLLHFKLPHFYDTRVFGSLYLYHKEP